jgi:hypothetical protein
VTDQQSQMLVETNTMVKMIYYQLPKLATCERVDAVEDKAEHAYAKAASVHNEVQDHVKTHEAMSVNRNLIAGSYIGGVAALGAALVAIFKK